MPNTPDRERNQPQERKKLGLLEKKKDYQKRSQDYNKKKATLKSLRAKAAEFNEDEFAYGMLSRQMSTKWSHGSKWSGLVNGDRGNKALSVDAARLLKTQDVGYLRTMRSVAHKEVKQREERLALAVALSKQSGSRGGDDELEFDFDEDDDDMDDEDDEPNAAKRPTRIVFMDDVDERNQAVQAQRDAGKDEAEDDKEEGKGADGEDGDELTEKEKIAMLQRKLQNSKKRLKALVDAEEELQAQRARMAKTPSYSGITKSGKKVKVRERKR